jgi:hypothetical protein
MDLKQQILNAAKKIEPVLAPEWGDGFFIRRMTAGEREVFVKRSDAEGGSISIPRLVVAICLCDKDGKSVFASDEELLNIDFVIVDRIAAQIFKINGLTKEAQDDIAKK